MIAYYKENYVFLISDFCLINILFNNKNNEN